MKRVVVLLACATFGCKDQSQTAAGGSSFDPVQFFAGHSTGEARLHLITGASRPVAVDSTGTPDGHGGLVLDQSIREDRKAPRVRRWVLHPGAPNHWSGTLTDAKGPVEVERTPTDVTIRYRMKGGPEVEQHLELQGDGSAQNHMSVTRFGVEIATLDEHIRKQRR